MSVLPSTHNALIAFFEERINDWAANAAAIGLTPAQLAELSPAIVAARASYDAAQAARIASKGATEAANIDRKALRTIGGDLVNTIKAFAEASSDPSVYQLAQVPMPKTPEPIGPPSAPRTITHAVNTDGSVALRWDGTRAGGTTWVVERSFSTTPPGDYGPWSYLGTATERALIDPALPVGASEVRYRIKAMRPAGASPFSAPYTVVLGVGPSSATQGQDEGGLSLAA